MYTIVKHLLSYAFVMAAVIAMPEGSGLKSQVPSSRPVTSRPYMESEISYQLNILYSDEIRANDPQKFADAIKWAGEHRVKEAVPGLIRSLDFRVWHDSDLPDSGGKLKALDVPKYRDGDYPAVEALFQIGPSVLAELSSVISNNLPTETLSRNALKTVQFIFREDMSKAVAYLENDASNSKTVAGQQRLRLAAQQTAAESKRITEAIKKSSPDKPH